MRGDSLPVQRFAPGGGGAAAAGERPAAAARGRLPVGLQLLCPAGEERAVLELAMAIEALEVA